MIASHSTNIRLRWSGEMDDRFAFYKHPSSAGAGRWMIAFCSTDIRLRWSREMDNGSLFYKHSAPLEPEIDDREAVLRGRRDPARAPAKLRGGPPSTAPPRISQPGNCVCESATCLL